MRRSANEQISVGTTFFLLKTTRCFYVLYLRVFYPEAIGHDNITAPISARQYKCMQNICPYKALKYWLVTYIVSKSVSKTVLQTVRALSSSPSEVIPLRLTIAWSVNISVWVIISCSWWYSLKFIGWLIKRNSFIFSLKLSFYIFNKEN